MLHSHPTTAAFNQVISYHDKQIPENKIILKSDHIEQVEKDLKEKFWGKMKLTLP